MKEAEVSEFVAPSISPEKEPKPVVSFKESTVKIFEVKVEPDES
jgi:hypothetical protein